ncbi:MAG: OmpH family outer membrane protein [Thermodesulfobacteriota bacterium]
MRRWLLGIVAAACLTFGSLGAAWSASTVKIGYIDLQKIIEKSSKGKELRERVQQLRQDKERILSAKQEELVRMRQDFQQKAMTLSDRARLDKEQELRQKEIELQNLSESFRQEVLMEGKKLQMLMFKDLSEVVKRIGQQEGFTMIIDKDATLFVSESIDITDKVLQQYDSQPRKGK